MRKTALITGSSRGIGRAIALCLSKDGFHVILHGSKQSDQLIETKTQIEHSGGTADMITADLCDISQTKWQAHGAAR